MSTKNVSDWLLSQNRYQRAEKCVDKKIEGKAKTISITAGKGGVGKTSVAIKVAKSLADAGYKTLLIDCDFNLANTAVKLGLPINDDFASLIMGTKSFEEVLHRDGQFHLLSGCNGNLDLFENRLEYDKIILDILVGHEDEYDFILLDSPAGIQKDTLTINAYSDYRFVVVTPDKSSITDSYSLMKILNTKYGVKTNHLLVNKVSNLAQYQKIVKTLSETVDHFLKGRVNVLGSIEYENKAVDKFDQILLGSANSSIHKNFIKVVNRFTEENISTLFSDEKFEVPFATTHFGKQEVQPTIC
ncbi:YhjQ protein [Bacteriovorax sp. BSW11_IV]|uniref:AAA family ATPase n=1 Tax=Bacteriovorax sp. BSW11_IV TaxID=1353529 RepID=UPI00038A09E6|nr:AAA family ATPase [Bacteriovorax sp. BSW11_IV]EQC48938.1 YhjQ protein [Bacteriovorax sp. BSW11_IV]